MFETSYQISKDLYLVHQVINKASLAKAVDIPTNTVVIIDCSGSMYSDLPKIREQLKLKLPKLLGPKDTISIIWFSSRGDYGTLIKGEFVSTLKDLSDINKAIDRWLRPLSLTGFKEPIEEAATLVTDLKKKNPGAFSLFFMSDGYDNQNSQYEIMTAVEKAAGVFSATTFVEYGYYCNRQLMTAMAEKAGGSLIFSEDFEKYEPTFESVLQKKISGAPKVTITITGEPVKGFIFASQSNDLLTFTYESRFPEHGRVLVPEDLSEIWYLSSSLVGTQDKDLSDLAETIWVHNNAPEVPEQMRKTVQMAYAAASLYGSRMQPDVVLPILRAIGDVRLIEKFSGCFGKQKYAEFCDMVRAASVGNGIFLKGRDPNKVPKDDAFTIINLLHILSEDDGNRVLMEHPNFSYSRIGRGRIDSSDVLTDEEQKEVTVLTAKIAAEKTAGKIREHQKRIDEILAPKKEALKFEARPAPDGYPIMALTFNEERPNISLLVRKEGVVDLSSRIPPEFKGKIPDKLDTFIWRNYAIIADGLVNVKTLPVCMTCKTVRALQEAGAPDELFGVDDARPDKEGAEFLLDLGKLPIINRKMVKEVFAKAMFELEYELTKARAAQKVYNAYVKDKLPPRKVEGMAARFGDAAALWLKDQGITDGGFSPKAVQAEVKDFYMGKELVVSIKGYSKLPSLKELREQIKRGKVNAPGALMRPVCEHVEAFLTSPVFIEAADQNRILEAWLDSESKAAIKKTRQLIFNKANIVFSIIVGQCWFKDLPTLEDTKLSITVDGNSIDGEVEMKEIRINI
jgi:hypothetical protein